MSELMELGREQLKQLNQDSLIELMLALQEQLAAQQVLIQELRDQLAKDRLALNAMMSPKLNPCSHLCNLIMPLLTEPMILRHSWR